VLATPHASNLDEFEPLRAAGVSLHFSRSAADIARADWLILPGSKHTRADLAWVRALGLEAAIHAHAAAGKPLLAVCGALQWAGEVVADPQGLEGGIPGRDAGLGLLPLHTRFEPAKRLQRAMHRLAELRGPWAPLAGQVVDGYQIHLGRTGLSADAAADCRPAVSDGPGLGWQCGPVLALYLHGLFENPGVVRALFGQAAPPLESVFDRLADEIDRCFAPGALMGLLSEPG
jgi:adenosylcobyric acid synthase